MSTRYSNSTCAIRVSTSAFERIALIQRIDFLGTLEYSRSSIERRPLRPRRRPPTTRAEWSRGPPHAPRDRPAVDCRRRDRRNRAPCNGALRPRRPRLQTLPPGRVYDRRDARRPLANSPDGRVVLFGRRRPAGSPRPAMPRLGPPSWSDREGPHDHGPGPAVGPSRTPGHPPASAHHIASNQTHDPPRGALSQL